MAAERSADGADLNESSLDKSIERYFIIYRVDHCGRPAAPGPRPIAPVESTDFTKGTMKTYVCIVCGFVYDEALGRPEEGIAAGTLWADVPDSWSCPDCGAGKADFEVVAI
jgi:rubredoxin